MPAGVHSKAANTGITHWGAPNVGSRVSAASVSQGF
jgi:hypothetical protein